MLDVFMDLSIVKEDVASLPYGSGRQPMDILHDDCVVDTRSSALPAIVVGIHTPPRQSVDRTVHKMSAHTRVHYVKQGIFWPKQGVAQVHCH